MLKRRQHCDLWDHSGMFPISSHGLATQHSNREAQEHFIFPARRFCRPRQRNPAGMLGFLRATRTVGFVACVALSRISVLLACDLLFWGVARAQVIPEGPVLAAADLREGTSLDGTWTYSIDPYRDGVAGFHGEAAGRGHRRWDDVDVGEARQADPLALYEYDMDTARSLALF